MTETKEDSKRKEEAEERGVCCVCLENIKKCRFVHGLFLRPLEVDKTKSDQKEFAWICADCHDGFSSFNSCFSADDEQQMKTQMLQVKKWNQNWTSDELDRCLLACKRHNAWNNYWINS